MRWSWGVPELLGVLLAAKLKLFGYVVDIDKSTVFCIPERNDSLLKSYKQGYHQLVNRVDRGIQKGGT